MLLLFSWSPIPGSGTSITDAPPFTTTYTAIGMNQCGVVSVDMTVEVIEYPIAIALTTPIDICQGQPVNLEALVQNEDIIYWSPNNSNTSTATVFPDFSQTYTIFASNFCGIASADFIVNVDDGPDITFITPDQTVCEGDQLTLQATAADANTFLWQPSNQSGPNINVTANASTTYTLTVANDCGIATADVNVDVTPQPEIFVVNGDQSICEGSATILEVDTLNSTDVFWMPGNIHSTSISVNPTTNTTYTAFAVNDCSIDSTEIMVDIIPPVQSDLELQACEGNDASYNGQSLAIGSVTDFLLTGPSGCDSTVTVTVIGLDVLNQHFTIGNL